jgi:peptidyl-tRNA hydrolase
MSSNKIMVLREEFEDTKGEIRIRMSKKNRQHNGQKKKYNEHTVMTLSRYMVIIYIRRAVVNHNHKL